MKKIILSLAVIALTSVVAVGVTRAYFSSTATSTGNTFSAGTLTLSLSAGSGSTNTVFNITGMAPGVEVGPQTLNYSNTGSIDGIVKLNTTYAFVSGGHGPVNEHDFARHLIVTSGVTDTVPVQGWWAKHVIEKYNDAAAALADGAIFDTGSSSTLPEVKYLPTVYGLSKVRSKYN
jgi:predicted ribosomally synthesized peptide with SipW-like signal peptide